MSARSPKSITMIGSKSGVPRHSKLGGANLSGIAHLFAILKGKSKSGERGGRDISKFQK
jgi:hypothetical protein